MEEINEIEVQWYIQQIIIEKECNDDGTLIDPLSKEDLQFICKNQGYSIQESQEIKEIGLIKLKLVNGESFNVWIVPIVKD